MKPVRRETLPALVAEEIKRDIFHGSFKSGDKLPPENELRRVLGVGRPTLREALRILEGQGWINFKLGEGAYVMDSSKMSQITSSFIKKEEITELLEYELIQLEQEGKILKSEKEDLERLKKKTSLAELERFYDDLLDLDERTDFHYVEPSEIELIQRKPFKKKSLSQIPENNLLYERIYGAWLGRSIGCLLGKPVEGWTKEQIEKYLKSTNSYPLQDYFLYEPERVSNGDFSFHPSAKEATKSNIEYMPRDDDMDYTILNLKIIQENGFDFTTEDIGEEWLLSLPYKQVYTAERQAYANLVMGIKPPGTAIFRNPFREWVGAQIRGDIFGYISPGNPDLAASMAYKDASFSHTKNGIYGEIFVAAAISTALVSDDLKKVIRAGLSNVPKRSRLFQVVKNVLDWSENLNSWEEVRHKVGIYYGNYHWVHVLPNLAYVLIGLIWGQLDFRKTVSIAVMCGGDTDCNGATAGSIIGAINGYACIPQEMSEPLNDKIRSFVPGYSETKISYLAKETYRLVLEHKAYVVKLEMEGINKKKKF